MENSCEVQREYNRIKDGPHKGYFSFVHHEGSAVEQSTDIMERVNYILQQKPFDEHYQRLRHIYPISAEVGDDYRAKRKLLDDDYRAKWKPLDDDYRAKWKPLDDDYRAKWKLLDDDYRAKRKPLDDDYRAKRKPLDDVICALIPNCAWDGKSILSKEI